MPLVFDRALKTTLAALQLLIRVDTHTQPLLNPSALPSLRDQLLVVLEFSHLFHCYEPTPVGSSQEEGGEGKRKQVPPARGVEFVPH